MLANKFFAGPLDRYLARTGYRSQQTDGPAPQGRPANLWKPVDESGDQDFGAHGRFDRRAKRFSVQLWLSQHRLLAATGALAVAGLAAGWRGRRR